MNTIHTINDIKKDYMFIAVGSTINTINDIKKDYMFIAVRTLYIQKGTWGAPGDELFEDGSCRDAKDPNYDSDSQVCLVLS
jgi:hypothetical protein